MSRSKSEPSAGRPGQESNRPWRGFTPQERDDQRRRRLLDAGLELFGTVGFRATTVQALCAEAGVATRSFYELYGSLDAVVAELYEQITAEIAERMAVVDLAGTDAVTIVRRGIAAALQPVLDDERKARVIEIEAVGVSEELEARRAEMIRGLGSLLETMFAEMAERGMARDPGAGMVGIVAIGGITQALVDHLRTPEPERLSTIDFLDELTRVLVLMLGR